MNTTTENSDPDKKHLLVIDDEENMRHMLTSMLKKTGYEIDTACDGLEALKKIDDTQYNIILCDVRMPHVDGMAFLKGAQDKLSSTTVIMMSAYGTIDMAVEAMKMGAYDFISKPFKTDEIHIALKKAVERESLKKENILLKKQIQNIGDKYKFGNMIAKSKAMKPVFELAGKVAQYNTTVLISGESGTGKELIARGIHFNSERADMPLVPVNCAAIPENLLESELFGHVKGAFTGADKNRKGLFEEAQKGTIFLDEIGELPLALQVKLLRVLQENEIRAVGDSKTRKIDVRIITATAKDLEEEVRQGRFREDLFYRLNVLQVKLPPLKERPEDIPLLCIHFIDKFNKRLGKDIIGIAPAAASILLNCNWPGNVRELENAIERAVVLAEKHILLPENFSVGYETNLEKSEGADDMSNDYSLKVAQKELEKKMIKKALIATGGNRTKSAKLLEISHPSLLSKIKTYKITI